MYLNKYLKYKNKYLESKKKYIGGSPSPPSPPPPKIMKEESIKDILLKISNIYNIPKNIIDTMKYDITDLYKNIIINVRIFNKEIKNSADLLTSDIPIAIFQQNQDISNYKIINNITDNELYVYVIFKLIEIIQNKELKILNMKNIYTVILNIDIMTKYKKYFKDYINHQLYVTLENNIVINSVNDRVTVGTELRQQNLNYVNKLNVYNIREELFSDINVLLSNKDPKLKFGKDPTTDEEINIILQFYKKYIDPSYIYNEEPLNLHTKIFLNGQEYLESELDKYVVANNQLQYYSVHNINTIDIIQMYIISRLLYKYNHIESENGTDALGITQFRFIHELIKNKEFMSKFIEFLIHHSIAETYSRINTIINLNVLNQTRNIREPNNAFIKENDRKRDMLYDEIKCLAQQIISTKK